MLILENFGEEKTVSGVRKITDDIEFLYSYCNLTDIDNMLISESGSLDRRLEILNVRALIKECGLDLSITYKQRKPIVQNGFIGISHSDTLAAIIWHPEKEIAIDVEELGERIKRISHRAFSDSELEFANNDLLKLNLLWNTKECVYKLIGIKGVDFKKQIRVLPFDNNNEIRAELISDSEPKYFNFNSSTVLNNSLVWGSEVK